MLINQMAAVRKKCLDCGRYDRFSKGLCKGCWKIKFGKPIRKVSVKHQQTINDYKVIRKSFLEKHAVCEAKLKDCTGTATEVHHIAGKSCKEQYLNEDNFLPVCRNCHKYIEEHPEFAKENGFSKNRL